MLQHQETRTNRSPRSNASNTAPGARSLPGVNVLQQKAGGVIQMEITDEVTLNVVNVKQRNTNSCWVAAGWSIHRFKGGTAYATQANFVAGQGSAAAKVKYANDQVNDIDSIIGSTAVTNHLKGSDVDDPFSKAVISKALNGGNPIVANVDGSHYVIICGKRKKDGVFELQIMDPATGSKSWKSLNEGAKVSDIGNYKLWVLYYL